MKEMLDIPRRFEMDATSIKQRIDKEYCNPGYWNTKEGIKEGEDAMILIRW